jgi:hypothetical protein
VRPLSELDERDDNEGFNIALDEFALKSTSGSQQVLVNFGSVQGRSNVQFGRSG